MNTEDWKIRVLMDLRITADRVFYAKQENEIHVEVAKFFCTHLIRMALLVPPEDRESVMREGVEAAYKTIMEHLGKLEGRQVIFGEIKIGGKGGDKDGGRKEV